MGTITRIHGGLPEGIRDHDGVLGAKPDASPQSKLAEARLRVKQLEHDHSEAQVLLRRAVEDEGGDYDFVALKANVHRLARELESAEAEVADWESVVAQTEKSDRERKFAEIATRTEKAKAKVRDCYLDAALALGEWYTLAAEAYALFVKMGDQLPNGTKYYQPETKAVLAALEADPNPLHQLLDNGYSELQTSQSWRRHCALVPLAKKEKR